MLIIGTRYHPADIQGHVMRIAEKNPGADQIRVVWLPAVSEGGKYRHPDDDREIGDALWPEAFDEEDLERIRLSGDETIGVYGGSYDWNSLYQGRPEPPGGSKIKRVNLKIVESAPTGLTWVRFWDVAVSKKTTADWSASGQMALDSNGCIWVRGLIHEQREWPTIRRLFKTTLKNERVPTGFEAVGTQIGFIQDLQTDEDLVKAGVAEKVIAQTVDSDKLTRALPWIARTEEGLFKIVAGEGVEVYIDELVDFTGHDDPHDDQVDWTSGAYRMLSESFEGETWVL